MHYIIVVLLLLFSALFSGLTLGLMGLSASELKRKMLLGDKQATRVYAIRKNGNLLLTTLLIGNVAVNATLSIFLSSLTSGLMAGILSTSLIVILGEIVPQAMFSRYALDLGSRSAWFVRGIMFLLMPVTWPIASVLNVVLGDELPIIFSKQELVKIIEEHEDSEHSDVREEEEKIVRGALTFSDKKVRNVLTPRPVVSALEASTVIDNDLLEKIHNDSRTRIPVYRETLDSIVGILYISDLLGSRCLGKTVGEMANSNVHFIDENVRLREVFKMFIKTHHHLFIVRDEFGTLTGVITLEDIMEEIIQTEILDEDDKHQDLRELARSRSTIS